MALLLLRAVLGTALLVQGRLYFDDPNSGSAAAIAGCTSIAAGALLVIGFLTPVAAGLVGGGAVAAALSFFPPTGPTLFSALWSILFAGAIWGAILLAGPGAFSVDARVFGRREIIIPPLPHARE